MELNHDWIGFQETFHPRAKGAKVAGSMVGGTVFLVESEGLVAEAFAENEDLSEWVGAPAERIKEQFKHRTVIALSRADVDSWIRQSLSGKHFDEQIGEIRSQAQVNVTPHFLIKALSGWWRRVLPSSFALLIRLQGSGRERSFIVLVRGGKVAGFERPELGSLGARVQSPEQLVAALERRYRVPVQAIFAGEADWVAWAQAERPWALFAESVRARTTRLVPNRVGARVLLFGRARLGI